MAESPSTNGVPIEQTLPRTGKFIVLYDGQCGSCQAWVSRMKKLDTKGRTEAVPVSAEVLSGIQLPLNLDDCLRQLHVVTPEHKVYVGWDAVARIARLFPLTWPVGALGALPVLRGLGRRLYRYVAAHRHAISQCRN